MDSQSSKDDDEPKICTVFSSDVSSSKTIFDTIAFTSSKKEDSSPIKIDNISVSFTSPPPSTFSKTEEKKLLVVEEEESLSSYNEEKNQGHGDNSINIIDNNFSETKDINVQSNISSSVSTLMDNLSLTENEVIPVGEENNYDDEGNSTTVQTANILFADAPDVPFPVGSFQVPNQIPMSQHTIPTSLDNNFFSSSIYSSIDSIYDAWIPSEETRKILSSISTSSLEIVPEKATLPGIVYEEEMVDKVQINMARIFGEAEASKRKILNADSVTQDDNGLRELIKLGCYRSAINLTKRLLTLYGQGPGKIGHFSKHTPHSLQLWYTRIVLLVRIREFSTADAEVEVFKNFENPDMYYGFYPEFQGKRRSLGSMVPFHFRILAAEIPQYMRKINQSLDKLTNILTTVEQILLNVQQGLSEDGDSLDTLDKERQEKSIQLWKKREIRVYYSLANASIFSKDFNGAVHYLLKLIEKDLDHVMQLNSSLGRLYLQFGDISAAQRYFSLAAELSNKNSESDRVETLVDAGLLAIGQNSYLDAFNFFSEALTIQPENYMLTNNMAVCLVYLGKVKDALALMESTVKQNTPQLLQENVILNLSTIYELENSDSSKKNALLKILSEYKGDGINLNSLKMPNLV